VPKQGVKMYIWNNPYHVDYGSSLLVVLAHNLRQAKSEAKRGQGYIYGEYERPTPDVKLGKPTRVLNLPCAEWHRWEE